jgi:hypothetical protein
MQQGNVVSVDGAVPFERIVLGISSDDGWMRRCEHNRKSHHCSFLIDILKQIYYLEKGLSTSLLTQFTIILT